jgi:hypothetical protein
LLISFGVALGAKLVSKGTKICQLVIYARRDRKLIDHELLNLQKLQLIIVPTAASEGSAAHGR